MNAADARAHPWPLTLPCELRWRRAVWPLARPWYMYGGKFIPLAALTWFTPIRFWFPFFTYNIKWRGYGIHGYIGWKPITPKDSLFPWGELDVIRQWVREGRLFVQLSWRGGTGAIS